MRNGNLNRYDEYKSSGVNYFEVIPKEWQLLRLKDTSIIRNSNVDKLSVENEKVVRLCNYVDVYKNEFIDNEDGLMLATANDSEIRNFLLLQDDVIVTKDSETFEDIAVPLLVRQPLENVVCGYHLALIRSSKKLAIGRYLHRLFQSYDYGFRFRIYSKGITRYGLGQNGLRDAITPIPPLPEQTAIANYLDEKTALIDKKINLLTQKADKYKELKQALINETVTRGLDKNVNLKDSGVECLSAVAEIGKIPVHWEVKRAKDIFYQTRAKAGPSSSSYDVLSLTLKGVIKRDLETMVGKIPASFDTYQIAKKDNLILCLFDMDVTPRIIGYVSFEGIVTSAYTVLVSMKNTISKYYYYYYLEQNRNKSLLANSKTLRSTMTYDLFSQLQVPVPPKNEQTQIAEYLDKKTSQIDKIVESINNQIEKLKELRKTLINDVVTGKIKVTE